MQFEVTIHDLSRAGSGVGKLPTGQIVFVPFSAPGDHLLIELCEPSDKEKSRFIEGTIVKILNPSDLRITPKCPIFEACGGCTWQHIPYETQWKTKVNGVQHALQRTGILQTIETTPLDEIPATQQWNYRNRIQIRSDSTHWGFFQRGTRTIVECKDCAIARPEINSILKSLSPTKGSEKLEIDIRPSGRIVTEKNQRHGATGFRQIHDEQNLKMRKWVASHLPDNSYIFDLYGGSGNLTTLESHRMKQIDVVDIGAPKSLNSINLSPNDPISSANLEVYNQDLLNFTEEFGMNEVPKNMRFWRTDVIPFLRSRYARHFEHRPIVVTDPPRAGLRPDWKALEKWSHQIRPKRWIHIGCDPDSFARDIKALIGIGFKLKARAVLDFFPQTPHVECLAVLDDFTYSP